MQVCWYSSDQYSDFIVLYSFDYIYFTLEGIAFASLQQSRQSSIKAISSIQWLTRYDELPVGNALKLWGGGDKEQGSKHLNHCIDAVALNPKRMKEDVRKVRRSSGI